MDVMLGEEQQLLRDSVRRFLADNYDFAARASIARSNERYSAEIWKRFADLGFLSAPFDEEYGGLGEGPVTTMILMKEFGRHLVLEPYLETVVIAGGLISSFVPDDRKSVLLEEISSGAVRWSLAWAERGGRYDLSNVATEARRRGSSYLLRGRKIAVTCGPAADRFLVSARLSGEWSSGEGIALFAVDRSAIGLSFHTVPSLDGRGLGEVELDDVEVHASSMLVGPEKGSVALAFVRDRAMAALCAEAVGIMGALNTLTLDYAKTRKQFGKAIGDFQAIQHRLVDMFIANEEALSLVQHLALSLSRGDTSDASRDAAGAKYRIGASSRFVGEQAIQIHGGMGMSEELIVGHYFKRLAAIDIQFGDTAFNLARFARSDPATEEERQEEYT